MKKNNFILNYVEVNIIILFGLLSLILKLFSSSDFLGILITSSFEVLTIFFIFLFFIFLQKKLKSKIINLIIFILFYFILIFDSLINLMQSYFFDEANLLRYNLLNFDYYIVIYFFKEILPIKIIFIFILFLIISYLISFYFKLTKNLISKCLELKILYKILFVVLYLVLFFNIFNYSNIYVNTGVEYYQSLDDTEIIIDGSFNAQNKFNFSNFKDEKNVSNLSQERVLVFVMESVTYNDFLENKDEKFFHKIKNNSHIYSNYYTTNQDSLTSLFALLTSNFVPYDAYTHNWKELYGDKIFNSTSLVDIFNEQEYYSSFFVSSYSKVDTLDYFNWDSKNYLNYNESIEKSFLCLSIFANQNACEDNAIIEKVKTEIKNKDKLFLFQEFIFGHGIKYNQLKKKSNVEYYNDYLLEIYNFLENENLLNSTTIVIVSDHGVRNIKNSENSEKYKIPLIVYNNNFNATINNDLFNHIDFKQILFNELSNTKLNSRNEIYYVGQTRTSIVGYLNKFNQSFSIKNNDKIMLIENENIDDDLIYEKVNYFLRYESDFVK